MGAVKLSTGSWSACDADPAEPAEAFSEHHKRFPAGSWARISSRRRSTTCTVLKPFRRFAAPESATDQCRSTVSARRRKRTRITAAS